MQSEPITFALTQRQVRALIAAISSDHTAPAEARAACNALWQQISGPAPVEDAPKRRAPARTLRPLPDVDYSRWDDVAPIGPDRAATLAELLQAANPVGMARALTGRDIRELGEISEREGMQLLHIQQRRAAQLAQAQQQPAPARLSEARAHAAELAQAQHSPAAYGAALLR